MQKTLKEFKEVIDSKFDIVLLLKIDQTKVYEKNFKMEYEMYQHYPVSNYWIDNKKRLNILIRQQKIKIKK